MVFRNFKMATDAILNLARSLFPVIEINILCYLENIPAELEKNGVGFSNFKMAVSAIF